MAAFVQISTFSVGNLKLLFFMEEPVWLWAQPGLQQGKVIIKHSSGQPMRVMSGVIFNYKMSFGHYGQSRRCFYE